MIHCDFFQTEKSLKCLQVAGILQCRNFFHSVIFFFLIPILKAALREITIVQPGPVS